MVHELWRRAPRKAGGRNLLDPWSASLFSDGFADMDLGGTLIASASEPLNHKGPASQACNTISDAGADGHSFWAVCTTTGLYFSTAFLVVAAGHPKCSMFELWFVVLEVCGGSGGISRACEKRGIRRGPVIELKTGFDLFDEALFMWVLRMCLSGRVWLLIVEPPCTTFSLARHPPLRDSRSPEGYDPAERLTHAGNMLGLFCAILGLAQILVGNEFLYEQPGYCHMRFCFWWKMLLGLGADSVLTPQCGYIVSGPVYLKMTVFLFRKQSSFWKNLYRPCTCSGVPKHTQLAGSLTTMAAEYPEQLCEQIAEITKIHMPDSPGPWLPNDEAPPEEVPQMERAASSLFTIVLSECLPWATAMKHRFREKGHINVQEAYAFRSICRRAPPRCRFVTFQDSLVNLSIEAKGRCSSPSLNRVLLQSWAEVIFRGQQPRGLHTPTWSLRADEPSRDKAIRPPRMCYPEWVWLLLRDTEQDADEAAKQIDLLPSLRRPEVRWMSIALAAGARLGFILGRGRRSAEGKCASRIADPPAAGQPGDAGAEGAPPQVVSDLDGYSGGGAARADCQGAGRVLGADHRVWLRHFRELVAAERPCRHSVGDQRRRPLGEANVDVGVASSVALAGARTEHPAHAASGVDLEGAMRGLHGVGVASTARDYLAQLLRLASTGRELHFGPWRLVEGLEGNLNKDPQSQAQSGNGKAAILKAGRRRRPPYLPEDRRHAEAWRAAVARFSRGTDQTFSSRSGPGGASAAALLSGESSFRRGDGALPKVGGERP